MFWQYNHYLLLIIVFFNVSVCIAKTDDTILDKITTIAETANTTPKQVLVDILDIRKKHGQALTLRQKVQLLDYESVAYMQLSEYQKALNTIEKITLITQEESNNYYNYIVFRFKGKLYWHLDMGQLALKFHLKAYEYLKNDGDFFTTQKQHAHFKDKNDYLLAKLTTENNIAYTAIQLGFYKKAIPFLENNLNFTHNTHKPRLLAVIYNNLGEAHFGLQNFEKAFEFHNKAFKIRKKNKLKFHLSFSYHNLALSYWQKKNFIKAKEYILESIKIRKQRSYLKGILESKLVLAKIFFDTKKFTDLESILEEIITTAKKKNAYQSLTQAYLIQQELFKHNEDFENAFIAAQNYHDSLEHIQLKKNNATLSTYLTQSSTITKDLNIKELKRNNELQVIEVKNEQQKNNLILSFSIVIVCGLLLFVGILQTKRKKIQLINKNLSDTLTQLQETQIKLIESEKMSSLTTLVTGIAHQMNTPLGIAKMATSHISEEIEAFNQALQVERITKTKLHNFVSDVEKSNLLTLQSIDRSIALIAQFKNISAQIENGIEEEFELVSRLKNHANAFSKSIMKQLTINVTGTHTKLLGYPIALTKVLEQLIQNSVDHGFKHTKSPLIDIKIQNKGNNIEITYQDNGCGVNIEHVNNIFDPFYTTNMGNRNIGIGLSIVYNLIVQLMKGDIICKVCHIQGTAFIINLPLKVTQT
ncbi:tetratricopeptide repeat-containing sensor histidine kinase [Pseudoalteromonas denitrificans]|uniref:histidine kinase n=1 Tax=Pseudoalteromonas denitrificans DSM 6059 TaxID=1123010 RepID=A0A1I1LR50_9GAMM|nr:tetratricopeptide repeat-containing sensor histidine kinase [Pseudoalteromonas denitrificans]SFC72773.1 Tetratricopeptide repeat-containing protein [Pseudoalteromonas denitrificans DSM 6059]